MIEVKKKEIPYQKVEIREPTVRDILKAQEMVKGENDFKLAVALIHRCVLFDGRQLSMEEIEELPISFFSRLSQKLREFLPKTLEEQLSSSQKRQTQA